MKPGDRVKIKTEDGQKFKALITDVQVGAEPIGAPGQAVQGPTQTTLTLTLEPTL